MALAASAGCDHFATSASTHTVSVQRLHQHTLSACDSFLALPSLIARSVAISVSISLPSLLALSNYAQPRPFRLLTIATDDQCDCRPLRLLTIASADHCNSRPLRLLTIATADHYDCWSSRLLATATADHCAELHKSADPVSICLKPTGACGGLK